jgi:hypothetical protein
MPNPSFEPELDQPIPRRVTPRPGGCAYGCVLWPVRLFILPHTLGGVFLIFLALSRIVLCLGVFIAGTDAEGRVVRKMQTQGKKGMHYSVEYVYTVDQADYSATVSMDAEEYATIREGQTFNVRVFVPGIEGGHWPGVGNFSPLADVLGLCFMALFWNGILSVFLYHLYYRPWRHRWMVRRGLPAAGLVRQIERWTNKGTKMVRVRYEYAVPPDGHSPGGVFSGKMSGNEPKPGELGESIVTVLYDPRRPKRNLLYALADFKAVAPR